MTNRTIDDIYESLGEGIFDSVETGWIEATIDAIVFEDSVRCSGNYIPIEGASSISFSVSDDAFDDFEELHEITTEGDSNQWNRAKFKLTPDGKFSIDFEWDQELADEVAHLNS